MNPPDPPPDPPPDAPRGPREPALLHGWPCVVVHGRHDAALALSPSRPLTLLSSRGAALFAGAGWWRALVEAARRDHPCTPCDDILDCADAPGRALEALRHGQRALVLDAGCPAFPSLHALAAQQGGVLLPARPAALDLADPRARRQLDAWLDIPPWLDLPPGTRAVAARGTAPRLSSPPSGHDTDPSQRPRLPAHPGLPAQRRSDSRTRTGYVPPSA